MGFYDPAALKEAAFDALRAEGWGIAELAWSSDDSVALELTHPELKAGELTGRLELGVTDPGMPGSWGVAAREAYYEFDRGEDSYALWKEGAVEGIARAEGLADALTAAVVARAAEIDASRASIAAAGLGAARRVIFDDDCYIDPEDFRDAVFDQTDSYDSPSDIPEELIWQEMAELRDVDLDDECSNVDTAIKGHPLIATGTLGLWNARPSVSFIASDFRDAYRKAMGRDCQYFRAWDENGRLMIEAVHHDGTNSFELRALNDAGVDLLGEMDADGGIDAALLSLDCYSEPPRVAERVYGRPAIEWEKAAQLPTSRALAAKAAAEGAVCAPARDRDRRRTV